MSSNYQHLTHNSQHQPLLQTSEANSQHLTHNSQHVCIHQQTALWSAVTSSRKNISARNFHYADSTRHPQNCLRLSIYVQGVAPDGGFFSRLKTATTAAGNIPNNFLVSIQLTSAVYKQGHSTCPFPC